jgi:hypothetical protein
MKIIRRAIRERHEPSFRVVHFNVLANHLHLITEASSAEALAPWAPLGHPLMIRHIV